MADHTETPGKVDDILFKIECLGAALSNAARLVREKYVDPDGTFIDLKISEVGKWLPMVQDAWDIVKETMVECFGDDITPEIKNEILSLVIRLIGLRL